MREGSIRGRLGKEGGGRGRQLHSEADCVESKWRALEREVGEGGAEGGARGKKCHVH